MTQVAPIALTCGEPAGIGPELAAKAWDMLRDTLPFVWLGDPRFLPEATPVKIVEHPEMAHLVCAEALPVLPVAFAGDPAQPGTPDPRHARGVIACIEKAVELASSGAVSAISTAPIHKKALKDGAAFAFPGHTEFLAHLGGGAEVVMMLASQTLRVVPATIHIALADVPRALTADLLKRTIRVTHAGLIARFGIVRPRLAVAGLNPHAGEGGTMGREELDMIIPALDDLRAEGLDIVGPLSADTMFHARARERYDAAIAMYHDQALIPIKTLAFDEGVNVTLGLPFIRTSPDHGTAFDIAGKGIARPDSLIASLRMAADMAMRSARRDANVAD
jgi:4-hydroxythreonine-4-phosphate dehydrogenase